MNYQEILNKGNQILKDNNIKSSNLDSELILSKILNKPREEILTNLNDKISENERIQFNFYLNIRKRKNPMSHILGFKFFWKHKFFVNKELNYAYDQIELAKFYNLYFKLMTYWKKIFPMGYRP